MIFQPATGEAHALWRAYPCTCELHAEMLDK